MPLIIWFDDSLKNTYEIAFPMMQIYGFKGVNSVITGYIGGIFPDPPYLDKPQMTSEELLELRNAGWDFVSHSVTHPNFADITEEEAETELKDSRDWMRNNLGILPICFVWPFGVINYQDIVTKYYSFELTANVGTWNGKDRIIRVFYNIDEALVLARDPNTYVVLHFHSIIDNPDPWENTPEEFEQILIDIYNSGVPVVNLSDITMVTTNVFAGVLVAGMISYTSANIFRK